MKHNYLTSIVMSIITTFLLYYVISQRLQKYVTYQKSELEQVLTQHTWYLVSEGITKNNQKLTYDPSIYIQYNCNSGNNGVMYWSDGCNYLKKEFKKSIIINNMTLVQFDLDSQSTNNICEIYSNGSMVNLSGFYILIVNDLHFILDNGIDKYVFGKISNGIVSKCNVNGLNKIMLNNSFITVLLNETNGDKNIKILNIRRSDSNNFICDGYFIM